MAGKVKVKAKFCAALLIALMMIWGCSENNEARARLQQNGLTIRLPGGDWGYPTPYAHYPRGPGGFKMCLIFDSLLERDENGLIPWLAKEYEIRDNGRQFVFTLREGVKWHDGTDLTAGDVAFSLLYASKHPTTWAYVFDRIEQVEVIDNKTVKVIVSTPNAAMLYNLGRTRIIPKHIWEKVDSPREFTGKEAVIGCGPFRLTDYSKEHGTYRFEAFDAYWGPRQRVKAIECVPVSEPLLAFEKGEIHLCGITPDLLPRFRNDARCTIVKSPGFWGYRLLYNMEARPCFQDSRIRQAVRYAVDPNELVDKIARGAAIPGSPGILPPDHVMYNPDTRQYPFDPERAGQLLSEAGFGSAGPERVRTNGAGKALTFSMLCSNREVRMAQIIKERLAKAGIGIEIVSVDGKTRDARIRNRKFEMAITGHGGWGADPDYLRNRFGRYQPDSLSPSDSGLPGYTHERLNRLLETQYLETDPEHRKNIVFEIQEILADEVPEFPLFYTTSYSVYRPGEYDGWMFMFDHHSLRHSKLSYLERGK